MQNNRDQEIIHNIVDNGLSNQAIKGSPIVNMMGTIVDWIDMEGSRAQFSYVITDDLVNGDGVVFGGILSSALDLSIALASMAFVPVETKVATSNLQVQFLRPCLVGKYRCVVTVVKKGRKLCFCSADLFDSSEKHVASATATNLLINDY